MSGAQENPPPGFQVQSTLVLETAEFCVSKSLSSALTTWKWRQKNKIQSGERERGRLAVLHFSFPVCLLNIVLDVHMCVTTEEEEPLYVDWRVPAGPPNRRAPFFSPAWTPHSLSTRCSCVTTHRWCSLAAPQNCSALLLPTGLKEKAEAFSPPFRAEHPRPPLCACVCVRAWNREECRSSEVSARSEELHWELYSSDVRGGSPQQAGLAMAPEHNPRRLLKAAGKQTSIYLFIYFTYVLIPNVGRKRQEEMKGSVVDWIRISLVISLVCYYYNR